jgi:hypothetical protein
MLYAKNGRFEIGLLQSVFRDTSRAVDLAKRDAVLVEQNGDLGLVGLELLVEPLDVGDELLGKFHPSPVWAGAGTESTKSGGGLGGSQRRRCAAGHQPAQQRVQLIDRAGSAV